MAARDEETAPLLSGSEGERAQAPAPRQSLAHKLGSILEEPLSPLTKVLLVAVLWLLILSSIFIGLFAGAQHKLNTRLGDHGGEESHTTDTVTVTSTGTTTASATSTVVSTSLTTAISTSTSVVTTTSISTATTTSVSKATSVSITTTTAVTTKTEVVPVPTSVPMPDTCISPECIMLSASILSSLDTSADPCENFYEFSNGGWLKAHPLPADKGRFGQFNLLSQENEQIVQNILESNDYSPSNMVSSYDQEILKKLRGLYYSCMDEDLLTQRGEEPLKHMVDGIRRLYSGRHTEIDSSQTVLGLQASSPAGGLTAAVAYLHSRGIEPLFSFDIDGDVGVDPNFMSTWFSQPEFGLPSKEYYSDKAIVTLYRGVIARLLLAVYIDTNEAVELDPPTTVENQETARWWPPFPWPPWGSDNDDDDDDTDGGRHSPRLNRTEKANQLASKVVAFEKQMAEASLDLDILYGDPIGTYNPKPTKYLTQALPQVQFTDYFGTLTPRAFPRQIIITYLDYPSSLSKILDTTDAEVIEAYLVAYTALNVAPHLATDTESWKAVRSLDEAIKGIKKGAVGDRGEFCVGRVERAMGFAAGRYFVNETFAGDSRTKGTKVITDIIETFKKSLKNLPWMDARSARAAAQKADAIRVKVGYPLSPNTNDAASIAGYYSLVKIDERQFFENMLSAASSDVYKTWQQLAKQRDPEKWEMYPSMVNAYFNPPANEIVFPAGILRPPFFSREWPNYLSYGSFGQVAAHELTHAFDSSGRLYNQQGKLEEWWSGETTRGFQVRQDCIVKQYSSYYVEDSKGNRIYVNGNLTSGENIGDSGLIQSYRAWKTQYDSSYKKGQEYLLPGLNFTREQLFFISFARAWAENIKPESAVQRVRVDPHSPNKFRVEGTVSNIAEFAEVWNCPAGAKLNPPREKRCIFW